MKKLIFLLGAAMLFGCARQATIVPKKLSCEYLDNPQVVDVRHPRLSWINRAVGETRNLEQSAYQIRVASSRDGLEDPDLWDSGKKDSDQCIRIPYEGKSLESRMECWWQVRVWDQGGLASGWSDPGFWRMGLLNESDWQASWIGVPWQGEEALPRTPWPDAVPEDFGPPAPLLRKEFSIKGEVESAVAYVSGLGYFELYLNGGKVGKDVLVPNQTNYGHRPGLEEALIHLPDDFAGYRVMYLAYDLTEQLVQGENALGGILGNGFYNPAKFWAEGYGTPRFLCQVHIRYADGREEVVSSDESWKVARSPISMNMVYWGETYDARLEQKGWNQPGFDAISWKQAVLRKAPEGRLVAHTAHPDRVMERLLPQSIKKLGEGHFLVDFGEEISGWVRLNRVNGPEGHEIRLKFNANLYSGDNIYICSGKGPSSYRSHFNWFVFSGVEVLNWPGDLIKEDLVAEAVYTYVEESAEFHTSNELFNEINTIWRRSQTGNMHGGIASDCPHRERSGYTGDGQLACMTVLHNYDARAFYQKWITDMREAQIVSTGYVPNGAPWQPGCGGGPAWGAAICVMPWEFYQIYGSLDMLEDNYEAMKGYVNYMLTWTGEDGIMHSQRRARDGSVLKWFNLGEWVPPGEMIPDEMVHTFYLWMCADITSRCADILEVERDAAEFAKLAQRTREAFWQRFYHEENGSYGDAGGNILALRMGVPDVQYARVVAALKEGLKKTGGHIDTGIIGTRFFFEVLAEHGMQEEAYKAMNMRTEPSFGRWIELGSTTTREHWEESGSYNHPMFGGGLTWFYRHLAGMQVDPDEPGYRHIIFKPQAAGDIQSVSYFNESSYGKAGISWSREDDGFQMEVQIPVGCRATVHVPQLDKGEYAIYEVGSGRHQFKGD